MAARRVAAILSDLGNVVVGYDNCKCAAALARHSPLPSDEIFWLIFADEKRLMRPYMTGALTTAEYRALVRSQLKLAESFGDAEFDQTFRSVFTPIEPVIGLWRRLRGNGLTLTAVSNIEELRCEPLEKMGIFALFDHLVLSFREGLIKPSEELMVRALDRSGVCAEEAVFIDDQQKNLWPAKALGIRTHLYKTVVGLEDFLAEQGLGDLIKAA